MKIALFCPLNPIKTGISDYNEELLFELRKHLDIDLFIQQGYIPTNEAVRAGFNIIPYVPETFDPSGYDEVLYHMGNNYEAHGYIYEAIKVFPGVVVLHDYVLQGFHAERYNATGEFETYRRLQKKYYGESGESIAKNIARPETIPIWESAAALDYPLNEDILESAKAVIVHSNFVKEKIQAGFHKSITKINHHGHTLKTFDRNKVRNQMGLDKDSILISSIGYINKNKRFDVIISALDEIKNPALTYVIAGKDRGNLLKNYIEEKNLKIIVKGHLQLEELEALIDASDICINLRYPTMGESSGTLLRMMGYGKPVLVTNFGSYADFPDYTVLKIDPDIDEKEHIKRFVKTLIQEEDFSHSIGKEAVRYVREECSIEKCALEYVSFLKNQAEKSPLDISKEDIDNDKSR
jgi:glycosyltransferase involved in cell wall biosynthesis